MTTTGQDFTLYQGEAKQLQVTISDLASITGLSAEWVLWSGAAKVTKTSALSQIAFSDLGDTIMATVTLASADTVGLTPGGYTHQLTLVDGDGDRAVVCVGIVTMVARRTEL